jgi:uncharacterized protein Veg
MIVIEIISDDENPYEHTYTYTNMITGIQIYGWWR